MKLITLEDVNNAIMGTDIKILSEINILDLSNLKSIPSYLFGIYIINLKYKESYIGMSSSNKGIQGRLVKHICETWHRNIVESINIFVTEDYYASFLEKILIKTFKPELNTNVYNNCSLFEFTSIQKQLETNGCTDNSIIDKNKENDLLFKKQYFDDLTFGQKIKPIPIYENVEIYERDDRYDNEYMNRYDYENKYGNSKFMDWLKKQKNRNDPIGDLSRDVINSQNKNDIKNIFLLRDYLKSINLESEITASLYDAYNEYKYIYLTEYRNQTENFGIILMNSINPNLKEQLTNNNFDFNYKIICKKYDEIKAIKDKNISNAWEEQYYNQIKNNDILNNDISYWNEHTIRHREIYNLKDEKVKIIKENYSKLLLEIDNEIEELLKKYGKDKEYIKESYNYSLIKHDIKWYSDKNK